jgi:hypothetical protein
VVDQAALLRLAFLTLFSGAEVDDRGSSHTSVALQWILIGI